MSARRQLGYCAAVILTAWTTALTIGAFMQTAPGLLPLIPLAVVWWAKDMPVIDLDAELQKLLTGV